MKTFLRWLNRFFRLEEINGADRCPTYLYRWTMLRCRWFNVYLHNFVGDDWSLDLHDHPKRFISIGLAGGYIEKTPKQTRRFTSPWIRTFPAEHQHRIFLGPFRSCWTLVVTLAAVRPWGFWHDGQWIGWKKYVGSPVADAMKSCGD